MKKVIYAKGEYSLIVEFALHELHVYITNDVGEVDGYRATYTSAKHAENMINHFHKSQVNRLVEQKEDLLIFFHELEGEEIE